MNKKLAILVIALFAMTIIPVSISARMDDKVPVRIQADADNKMQAMENAKGLAKEARNGLTSDSAVTKRLKVCADFLRKNKLSDTPLETCKKMMEDNPKCAEILNGLGVEDAEDKCSRILDKAAMIIKERAYIAKKVTEAVSEWRLKRADSIVDDNPAAKKVLNALSAEKAEVFMYLTRAQQKKMIEKGPDEAGKELGNMKLEKKQIQNLYQKREIAKEKLEKAKKAFENAKNEYSRLNGLYNKKKGQFEDVKEKLGMCEGNETINETLNCTRLREQAHEHARDFVMNGIDMAIKHLEKIKTKAQEMEGLTEEEEENIVKEIDGYIEELKEIKTRVENSQTKEELTDAAGELKDIWEKIRKREKLHAARMVHSEVWGIMKRSENLEDRLEAILADMEERGIDTSSLDEMINRFSEHVASAKENIEKAEDLYKEARSLNASNETQRDEIKNLTDQAKELVKDAHQNLKNAHKVITDIVKEIRELGGDLTIKAAEEGLEEDEVYEVVEEYSEE